MTIVPQIVMESCTVIRFCVKNQGTRIWFEHDVDLMHKKDNGLKSMSNEIADRRNKFAFLVFKKLEEETGSRLEGNGGSQHHVDIRDIHDRARELKDEIRREYQLSVKRADKYEKQVPTIDVSVSSKRIHIVSDDWLEAYVGKYPGATDVDGLYDQIKERFRVFDYMVHCKLEREIKNTLLTIERAFFKDRELTVVKTDFEQRVTVQIFELKKWLERVSIETVSGGVPNPDYIKGTDVLAGWDLTRFGSFAQVYATKTFHEKEKLKVVGVENNPQRPPGKNPKTGKEYDADIWLKCDGMEIPVQVGVREGELALKVSDAAVCLGEEVQPNEAVGRFGATKMGYGKEPDFKELCKKLEQVPPGGVVLWMSPKELLPGSGPRPLKEWYGKAIDEKCVIVWVPDDNNAVIHHNNTGFDPALARKLCMALGVSNPDEQTDSKDSLTGDYAPDDVEGALNHIAHMSEYPGWSNAGDVVLANDLVSVLRHVVVMYMKSVADNDKNRGMLKCCVEDALSILEKVARDDNIELDMDVLVEICCILQDIAANQYDDYVCKCLWIDEIYNRLHLRAFLCIIHFVRRLRGNTPPEVLKTLTTAAECDGQEGIEYRIAFGYTLNVLRSVIPDWYVENESLLFGKDSPDGMNVVLMRVCSHTRFLDDSSTMEKYRALVLEALGEEIQHMRLKSETGNRVTSNRLMMYFMIHVLRNSRGFGINDSVRALACIGPDAVFMAVHECGWLIMDENTEKEFVNRGVQFWEAVLDSSPEPAALYSFGRWSLTKSIDKYTWEWLMLRTCEATDGLVEDHFRVIDRAWSDGNPTESGTRIIKLAQRANRNV